MNPSLAEGARARCRKEFLLVSNGAVLGGVCVSAGEAACVHIAVGHLRADIRAICRREVPLFDAIRPDDTASACVVAVATTGTGSAIERALEAKGISAGNILGQREAYSIQRLPPTRPNEPHVLGILGADAHGARRGVYALCEALGADPMSPFTGFVPAYRPELRIDGYVQPVLGRTPPVRYRGVFINDEERIKMWLGEDPINLPAETFERIFEAVVRSDGNMIAPPMYYTDYMNPDVRKRCQDFGIYYTASHMEMLLFNPQCPVRPGHWPDPAQTPFDYLKQASRMEQCWRESVRRHRGMRSVWPLGLRDAVDAGMVNRDLNSGEQAALTQRAVEHQLRILDEELGQKADPVADPTTITLYKEVLDQYNTGGLKIPRETIIVWPDDNYGRVRQLPNETQRRDNPRNGVYYHVGYCRNQWTSWVSARMISAELGEAVREGCNEFVLVNVSDGREFAHGWRAAMALCSRPELLGLSPDEFSRRLDQRFWATYVGPRSAPEAATLWNRLLELIYRRLPYWHTLYATQSLQAMERHLAGGAGGEFKMPAPLNRDCETGPLFDEEEWDAYAEAVDELGRDMRALEGSVPRHGKRVFHDQFVVSYVTLERANLWVRGALRAVKSYVAGDRGGAAMSLRAIVGILGRVEEAREKASWGPFKHWYRGDWHELHEKGFLPDDHPDWNLRSDRSDALVKAVLQRLH
jgi:hypothetical protein